MSEQPQVPYLKPANLKARLKAAYDAIAPTYNAWTIDHSPKRLEYVDRLIGLLRPVNSGDPVRPLRVLELGCGAGLPVTARLLTALAPVHVVANDLSSTQLQLAREALGIHGEKVVVDKDSGSTVDWIEGDMMALYPDDGPDRADATLDAVFGFYSIIHLPRDEQAILLTRIARWLRPGGYLLANFSAEDVPGVVIENWLREKEGWMFWSGWGADGIEARIRETGMAVVQSRVETDDVDGARFLWMVAQKPVE
ncbi:stomatin family protein [Niveomyces insectorum RCEF 264]|uniref:Stomatin family protein n=1 Tax=Niveomyces insectorum RCEF 264 TaxID=1081102 RepID=A0A167ST51_9HYPO|nr:stomatin family protein [Niveomyces insectorum RCEF 264]